MIAAAQMLTAWKSHVTRQLMSPELLVRLLQISSTLKHCEKVTRCNVDIINLGTASSLTA